jgi:hypothetical protein
VQPAPFSLVALANSEPDGPLRTRWRCDQLPQRFEDLAELLIMLAEARANVQFHLIKSRLKLLEGASDAPQLDECTHDLDVHGDGPIAA